MRLAFIDFIYGYDAARPDASEPLGGTTSAACFLARAMVNAGIECDFFNRIDAPREAFGIESHPLQSLSEKIADDAFDAYIFCGRWTADLVGLMRKNTKKPLIAWMHESAFAEPMTPALEAFDGVVFVSEWQRRINAASIKEHWACAVIRNAMNPAAQDLFQEGESVLAAKTKPPVLLYAGGFARGAFHIPLLLDEIRKVRSDFSVEVYCNLNPSRDAASDAAYIEWFKSRPNVAHVGMVGQRELIGRMKKAAVMIAPNPWPETSCIAMIEGLASGCDTVATARAALPETASGFARLVPIELQDEPKRFDMPLDLKKFAGEVLAALQERDEKPEEVESRLRRQINYFRDNYRWSQRVEPWVTFINKMR